MTTNNTEREAFEEWFESQCSAKPKQTDGIYQTMYADGAFKGWQAAKSDSEKEIVELKNKINYLESGIAEVLETENLQLQAHINVLRKALKNIRPKNTEQYEIIRKALSTTPTQSLQAHDDEVIERCAMVCDELSRNDGITCANEIRELKGEGK